MNIVDNHKEQKMIVTLLSPYQIVTSLDIQLADDRTRGADVERVSDALE